MNRCLALLICLGLSGASIRLTFAQNAPAGPPAHAVVITRQGGGYLGVGVLEIDQERAKALKLKENHGVELKNVEEGSPAAKAGLQPSDVIVDFNGRSVTGVDQFVRMVRETAAARKIAIKIVRNGSPRTIWVAMGSRLARSTDISGWGDGGVFNLEIPDVPEMPESPEAPEAPEMPDLQGFRIDVPHPLMSWQSSIGVEAESLSAQLAEYFGVKNGVLVRSVVKGSAAERSGLKAGDVITKVEMKPVTTPGELAQQIRQFNRHKDTLALVVTRSHREINMAVTPVRRWPGNQDLPASPPQ